MKTKYSLIALLFGWSFSSCSLMGPIDDIHPEHVLDDETVITDAASAAIAVNGIYDAWRGYSAIYNAMFVRSGAMKNSNVSGARSFNTGNIKDDNVVVQDAYTAYYYVVNQANSVIAALTGREIRGLTEARRAAYIKEARFNRALAHFQLLRLYGEFWDMASPYGIVVNEEPVRDNAPKARSTVRQTYASILADLSEAETLPANTVMYKAGTLSAKALKAKVMLSAGDYEGAFSLAGEVIAEGKAAGVELDADYPHIFTSEQGEEFKSSDLLFYPYTMNSRQKVTSSWYDWQQGAGATLKKIASLYPDDKRYEWAFTNTTTKNSYKMNKYQMSDDADNVPGNSLYMLRVSEMYLVRAEAALRCASPDHAAAREALRPIMERAGLPSDAPEQVPDGELLMTVFHQKYLELFGENFEDWFDMVRYNKLDGTDWVAMGYVTSWANPILPIPRAALAGNGLLKTNP